MGCKERNGNDQLLDARAKWHVYLLQEKGIECERGTR